MGCWKWFDNILKEAGIEATDENRDEIDEIIHEYVSEQAKYGRCSTDWIKAQGEIQANELMKQELIEKLRLLYLKWIRYKDF
jgi:uncharacterized coiled-coil DUF342 family protein